MMRHRIRSAGPWVAPTIFLLFGAGTMAFQVPSPGGSVAGIVVVDEPDAPPARRVTMTLTGGALRAPLVAASDDEGRFRFGGLPAGRYTLTAARPGFVTTYYGSTSVWRPPGVPIVLGPAESVGDLVVRIVRGAVVTGRVTDEYGRPVLGAAVAVSGARGGRFDTTPAHGVSAVETDDRGIYRAYGLPPGSYVVGADWPSLGRRSVYAMEPYDRPVGFVPVYHPGTADVNAIELISLAAGQERSGLDIVIRPVLMSVVSGRVLRADGSPAAGLMVNAAPARALPGRAAARPTLTGTGPDGDFTFSGLPPGVYSLGTSTRTHPDDRTSDYALLEVWVRERDLSDLVLQLQPSLTVRGRVTMSDGSEVPAEINRLTFRLSPLPADPLVRPTPQRPAQDGRFEIGHLLPGRYVLHAEVLESASGPAWMVESAVVDGVDLLKAPLEIPSGGPPLSLSVVLTDKVTELSGRLLDQTGKPAPEFHVLVFPTDRELWALGEARLRPSIRPGTDGVYRAWGLLPGRYFLAAVTDMQPEDHADPDFLERLVPGAITVTVGAGERTVQDVQLVGK